MARRNRETSNSANMSSQCELKSSLGARTALGEIPYLEDEKTTIREEKRLVCSVGYFDGAVGGSRDEPFIRGVEGNGAHPAQMT